MRKSMYGKKAEGLRASKVRDVTAHRTAFTSDKTDLASLHRKTTPFAAFDTSSV